MADITCTITKSGRCDKYGRPLVAGSSYTGAFDEVRSLYLAGFATVSDVRIFDDDSAPSGSYFAPIPVGTNPVASIIDPVTGKVEADFWGINFCPPKSYRASGSAAAPVSTFNGASSFGVLGKPASILIPANFLINGSGQIEAKIRIKKTGPDASSYFQMHIGPTDGTGDPNALPGAGSTQFSATTPYDATFTILAAYKSGKFSISFQRDVPNVGSGLAAIEFTGTYDNTVDNYINFVITGATAGNAYDLLAYSVNVFQ